MMMSEVDLNSFSTNWNLGTALLVNNPFGPPGESKPTIERLALLFRVWWLLGSALHSFTENVD
jgi:hypothetical protein